MIREACFILTLFVSFHACLAKCKFRKFMSCGGRLSGSCGHNEVCKDLYDGQGSVCVAKYTRDEVRLCKEGQCKNGGKCTKKIGVQGFITWQCVCTDSWKGQYCTMDNTRLPRPTITVTPEKAKVGESILNVT